MDQTAENKRVLSPLQFGLFLVVFLLAVSVEVLIIRGFFSSGETADDVKQASYVITNLANIQRETLLLRIETDRVIRGEAPDTEHLTLRRALLANQLQVQSARAAENLKLATKVRKIQSTLDEYNTTLASIEGASPSELISAGSRMRQTLTSLERQVKRLYDGEEHIFFSATSSSLRAQRDSQMLLLGVGSLVLLSGLLLGASLRRTLHKLRTEMSERWRAEEALRESLLNLEVTVEERTEELVRSNEDLKEVIVERELAQVELLEARDIAIEASRAKSDFLASMSHEIRTPMNSIIAVAELLSKTPLNSQQQKYVQVCGKAGDTLLTLINDILDLSKVEAGQLTLEKIDFDVGELVEETVEFLAIRAHEKNLELNCQFGIDVPTVLVGDPVHLRQVIINLVGNAIKFTQQGGVVLNVENNPGASEAGSLLFRVSDTGIGIPTIKMDSIFDDFSQADSSTTREYGGTGLGLAISRRLVEMMEGHIWVESQVGEGSTFYFTAQFETWAEPNEHTDVYRKEMKGLKVMIVDDNATSRLILKEMLAVWGITAMVVEDGYHAFAEIDRARKEDQPYQLVLLDHRMPGMDGIQVAEQFKANLGMIDRTVMMLASDNQSEDIACCQEIGISRYLMKPIKRSELLQTITVALGLAAAEEPPPLANPDTSEDQRCLRILLVDDFEVNCFIIQSHLEDTPYQIDMAENGQIAVEKFIPGGYDLVLMDMQMPVMDGYTATKMIRQWESEQGITPTPIIALTAFALKEDAQKSLDAGCTTHVTKPIKRAPLMEAIYEVTRSVMA